MREVRARFTGTSGTLAHFGDSITTSTAYWTPLAGTLKYAGPEAARAHTLVNRHMKAQCWRDWKGAEFGNDGRMTIRWAHQNVDRWLKRLNPEAVVIMFGSNDVIELEAAEYETKTREVVRRSLTNGTVVLLTTMPPRSGRLEKARAFAETVRKIAREERVPLIDYFAEILKRRPDDWDGALPQFKRTPGNDYQVPTLIARDGVHPSNPSKAVNNFSEEALKTSGFALRNYLTLLTYADVIDRVLQPALDRQAADTEISLALVDYGPRHPRPPADDERAQTRHRQDQQWGGVGGNAQILNGGLGLLCAEYPTRRSTSCFH
jgi:lysophospholipase L1-like esterase